MDSQPGTLWGREPAMVLALVQAVIALVVAFGPLALAQTGANLAVTVSGESARQLDRARRPGRLPPRLRVGCRLRR